MGSKSVCVCDVAGTFAPFQAAQQRNDKNDIYDAACTHE